MRATLLAFLGVAATACTDLPAITAGPTDGGTTTLDGATGERDAAPNLDAGPPTEVSPCDATATPVHTLADQTPVYCDGEWALVLKADAMSKQFAFDGPCWQSACSIDAIADASNALAEKEARYAAYSRVRGTHVRIVMKGPGTNGARPAEWSFRFAEDANPASLAAKIVHPNPPARTANVPDGAPSDMSLVGNDSAEGLSLAVIQPADTRVRIGRIGKAQANGAPWFGVGGLGACQDTAGSAPTVGGCNSTTVSKAFAYVYVK
jgi:hypothetical protein